jgi:1L-myo-inositol 1-phosphate cytidylyltransferase / CDP-L-myo-inositol myo-inositolphosphotransferase
MNTHHNVNGPSRPTRTFPLVRHVSYAATRALAMTPLSPNQITGISLVAGLGAAWQLLSGRYDGALAAGVLLIICYVLDNCDGEIARMKQMSTSFGRFFDTFVDWIVHATFFAALGIGTARVSGEVAWAWLGWIAFAGASINYGIGLWEDIQAREYPPETPDSPDDSHVPQNWQEHFIYFFRELSRADFCFLVLILALLDVLWLLLPAGAIGAQVYWLTGLVRGAKRYHV